MTARVKDIFVIFECPNGQGFGPLKVCQAQVVGPDAPWRNIGTADRPTLHQSYHCKGGCGWHGYIVDGVLLPNPVVEGAAASVTTLLECASCHHPELLTVGLTPGVLGLEVKFQRTVVREP